MNPTELQQLIAQKIENLRPKLLDLSRRNPLIATRLSGRTASNVRIVDELPDLLFSNLNNHQFLQLVPLPDIEADPKDEDTRRFRQAYADAKLTDDAYLSAVANINQDAEDFLDRMRVIDRALKDRIRAQLGMPPRPKASEINLIQHAKNNGVDPSFDLPLPNQAKQQPKHCDDKIQTLLLPKDFERRLNSISAKCQTWMQETGLNVLQMAYGFLEWSEPGQPQTSFAPLILASVKLEKVKGRVGSEFWLSSLDDEAESNSVLAEKLKNDFGIVLPPFASGSLEAYFHAVQDAVPQGMIWRVRRQVALGVFPSARMAMFHDLATADGKITGNKIVQALLAGIQSNASAPFADEYDVDKPEFERYVPFTVLDADSSQISTLVDIATGKNLAVEGPPGTGKSQTIVNAIACALAEGKKVLFVAEKLAALNVVRSRLEAVGLGEYLLPLQAERSTRERVVQSVRARLEMPGPSSSRTYESKLTQFKSVRAELSAYIAVLASPFRDTGLTVHEVLGRCIAVSACIEGIPLDLQRQCRIPAALLNNDGFARLRDHATQLHDAHHTAQNYSNAWRLTSLSHPSRFTIEEVCHLASQGAIACRKLATLHAELIKFHIDPDTSIDGLEQYRDCFAEAKTLLERVDPQLLLGVFDPSLPRALSNFVWARQKLEAITGKLSKILATEADAATLGQINHIHDRCLTAELSSLDVPLLKQRLADLQHALADATTLERILSPLIQVEPAASNWLVSDIAKAFLLVQGAGRGVLAIRNAQAAQGSGPADLMRLCREGKALREHRNQLSERLSLLETVSLPELMSCLTTIRAAGTLSFLSVSYRRARTLAASVTLSGGYKKRLAIQLLEDLISFRKAEAEFVREATATALFGRSFRGLDTDFETFERLANFYHAAHAAFSTPEKRPLRTFLRDAQIDDLELLPAVPQSNADFDLRALRTLIASKTAQYQKQAAAIADLHSLLSIFKHPTTLAVSDLQEIAKDVREVLALRDDLDHDLTIAGYLGSAFSGSQTDVSGLSSVSAWSQLIPSDAQPVHMSLTHGSVVEALDVVARAIKYSQSASHALEALCNCAQIPIATFTANQTMTALADILETASTEPDGLAAYAALAVAVRAFDQTGASPLVSHAINTGLSLAALADQVVALAIRQLARQAFDEYGAALTHYSGVKLDHLRERLAELDREIIVMSRQQLRAKVYVSARPPPGNSTGRKSTWSELALLQNEAAKQQRFIPVRELTQRAGRALLELKPCWMLSPLAVAHFIPKGGVEFDLCIIDEASQMPPEAAIGALARCKQVVVVGDTNQLPPSSFFKSLLDDEDADEDETVLDESILQLANATFRPSRCLRWHYRSRHSGLIKFSNHLVYDDRLLVFPSATEGLTSMGVQYKKIDGAYKGGTNPTEARAVVDAILEFMRIDPKRSLGIVTLNQKQRDLIREEFESAASSNPAAMSYLEAWNERRDGLEEFFIKNLETVQGDERDVIFISTVYGPERIGARVAQRFGPVNGLAGKRRLNVLFSRAKEKIVTFSSMTAADVLADERGNPGAHMLKRWLEYSATGVLESGGPEPRPPDSDFEVFVADQIRAMGFEAIPQVGVAGYFIDIGVRHPNWPHGYVLGVECDGAAYHSAKSARDRDRLRQEVLEGLGWHLHRIWSTDWFNNAPKECDRLRAIITQRVSELKLHEEEYVSPAGPSPNSSSINPIAIAEPASIATRAASVVEANGHHRPERTDGVAIGDTVRIRYLDNGRKSRQFKISYGPSLVDKDIVNHETPLAQAVLGAEEGEEVQILVGTAPRRAVVEAITRQQVPTEV